MNDWLHEYVHLSSKTQGLKCVFVANLHDVYGNDCYVWPRLRLQYIVC